MTKNAFWTMDVALWVVGLMVLLGGTVKGLDPAIVGTIGFLLLLAGGIAPVAYGYKVREGDQHGDDESFGDKK